MTISLYDASVGNYLQLLGSISTVLDKAAIYAQESNLSLVDLVETRMHPDMLPFRFQVVSVVHHSLGAINGIKEAVFSPPPDFDGDYAALQNLVADAIEQLKLVSREEVDALAAKSMKFKMGDFEIPFTSENFVLTFSLPNFYFHATTTYTILRSAGVPLGKRDYLGNMRVGG